MHKYLRSVGFSKYKRSQEVEGLIKKVFKECDFRKIVKTKDRTYAEFAKEFAENCGLKVCGEIDDVSDFHVEHCFPYFEGKKISSVDEIEFEELSDRDGFIAAYEDLNLNITMIFTLTNIAEYYQFLRHGRADRLMFPVSLSGLSTEGKILLPVFKSERFVKDSVKKRQKKNALIAAAKKGDESAIEILALEELDVYNEMVNRSFSEDIYSIVDNSFVPHGYESNVYSVIGDIDDFRILKNSMTDEKLYVLDVVCNDVCMDVCINSEDLQGEPAKGMRFKGVISMQGTVDFMSPQIPRENEHN